MERGFHNFSIKMRKEIIFLIFLILLINFSSALEVEISCPEKVSQGEEFICKIEIQDFESSLDVKLDIKGNGERISQILEGEKWKSSFYYYQKAIESEGKHEIKMRIYDTQKKYEKFTGNANAEFILRINGGAQAFRKNFNIEIEKGQKIKEEPENEPHQEETGQKNTTSEKININTVTAKELEKLDGIGSSYAQRIIESRPFYSLDDLIKVTGIGPAILNRIKEQGLAYVEEQDTPEQELNQTSSEESSESKTIKLSKEEPKTENVIKLNKQQETEKTITGSVVYQSKTENIRKYAIYAFSILLVGVIFLIIKK
jgi:competence ComEA-like helix-hairpin-helix protein